MTHLDEHGRARMVDVSDKQPSDRSARASARVRMSPATAHSIVAGDTPKGGALTVARLAGIQAAKRAGELIPLAHTLAISFVDVTVGVNAEVGLVELVSEVRTTARTGVEMEAMTACAVAALALYDMVKGLERGVRVESIVLLEKTGGRSYWRREDGLTAGPAS